VLGILARRLIDKRLYEELGFRGLEDWARERIGMEARTVSEWARVWKALETLPCLRGAVVSGEISWTVARLVVVVATPETDRACLESVRGRTVRAVAGLVRAVRGAQGRAAKEGEETEEEDAVTVRMRCTPEESALWTAACELARRVAGEEMPLWRCADAVAGECLAALDPVQVPALPPRLREERKPPDPAASREPAFQAQRWPHVRWREARRDERPSPLAALTHQLDRCSALALDRRIREAIAFLQAIDLEMGRILKQVLDRKLHRELGFDRFDLYVQERLDLPPRTARRLVALARAEHASPQVATAFRSGEITRMQAELLVRGGSLGLARRVTLRRLEDEVGLGRDLVFRAPPAVAWLFAALVSRHGLLRVLAHPVRGWLEAGHRTRGYEDFERDGWRCLVPGCTARRNLHSHHLEFLSHGGPDEPWNRATLCAFHHLRGVHLRRIRITGRAPDALVFELAIGRYAAGDVKMA
jgi:hypothetical protein